jgi:hypothetical protein
MTAQDESQVAQAFPEPASDSRAAQEAPLTIAPKPGKRNYSALAVAANAYLVAFTVDASFSVLDELLRLVPFAGLLGLRNTVAEIVVLASYAVAIALIFIPRLPKRVLLLPVLFALWCAIGAVPLSITYSGWPFDLAIAAAQLAIAAIAFATIRFSTSHWLFTTGALPQKSHVGWRIASNVAATIVALPLVIAALLFTSTAAAVEQQTDGYIHFGLGSIDARETTLTKPYMTVRLVGMVHIAEPQFYQSLIDGLPPHSLVLAEGVTDRDKRLSNGLSYRNAARAIGLQQQPNLAAAIAAAPAPKLAGAAEQDSARPTVERADIDISDFSPTTIHFLRGVSDLYASKNSAELLQRWQAIERGFTQKDYTAVFDDILAKRNRHLIAEFDARSGSYNVVVIPWGAEHMPFVEAQLRKRGFRIQSQQERRVAGYGTIFAALFEGRRAQGGTR